MLQFKKVAADKKVEGKGKKKKVIESVNGGGDDMISETEFVDYFSKIMKVETSHAKALFRVADTSGDGFLEYREFLGLLSILCCGGWKRPAHLASDRASWPASHGLGPALCAHACNLISLSRWARVVLLAQGRGCMRTLSCAAARLGSSEGRRHRAANLLRPGTRASPRTSSSSSSTRTTRTARARSTWPRCARCSRAPSPSRTRCPPPPPCSLPCARAPDPSARPSAPCCDARSSFARDPRSAGREGEDDRGDHREGDERDRHRRKRDDHLRGASAAA